MCHLLKYYQTCNNHGGKDVKFDFDNLHRAGFTIDQFPVVSYLT